MEYNVQIDELNLYWMDEHASAPLPMHNSTEASTGEGIEDSDLGPAPQQTLTSEVDTFEKVIGRPLDQFRI
jgi:hypothetical protein